MDKERQTVLIVEDQAINRQVLRRILEQEYDVAEAENGRRALEVLQQNSGVSAILLDLVMPELDGYGFLKALKSTPFSSLPVVAVTSARERETEQKVLDLGAWDFISKPYDAKILMVRLKNVIIRSQFYLVSQMKHIYEHDALTDLYNRTGFFDATRRMLDRHPEKKFVLARFDIDNFHLLNSFWGEEEGNRFLRYIADSFRARDLGDGLQTYARITADVFCLCHPFDPDEIRVQMDSAARRLAEFNRNYLVEPTLGLYVIDDPSESINTMYERATLAARECKKTYLQHLCYYEPEMSSRIQEEQQIVHEMHSALDSGQFVVYLQPKYNLSNEQPYGAEALIRWQHPQRGLLSPGSFIPVFERNGLIGKVDRYMWEQVCMLLRKWLDEGRTPAPISVNVSRVNMYNPNLIGVLTGLLEQYRLSPALLNLELTESVYMDNPDLMGKTVRALQQAGFVVMMDDFGSGYSSLNVLQNIPVDVLKIDMKFLADETASTRNECILASVIRMAGWLETPVIMEGVETSRQVDFLKSIGCSYVQGYYYAKPMPVSDYEALISRSDAVPVRSRSENHDAMFHTIWSSSPQIDLLFNSIRQPAAIYEFSGGVYHALRVNTSFSQIFGYGLTPEDNTVLPYRHLKPEEQEKVTEAFLAAASTRKESRCDYVLPKPHRRGRVIRLSLQYWGSNEDSDVLFALFSDITCLSE